MHSGSYLSDMARKLESSIIGPASTSHSLAEWDRL